MTTGLSDQQLLAAFDFAYATVAVRGGGHVERASAGLRAVADLATTHLEATNHSQTVKIGELESDLEGLRMELTILQRN